MLRSIAEWIISTIPGVTLGALGDPELGVPLAIGGLLIVALYELSRKHQQNRRQKALQNDLVNDFRIVVSDLIPPTIPIKSLRIVYELGVLPSQDVQRREYEIELPEDAKPVVGKELLFGVAGANVPTSLAIEKLNVQASFTSGEGFPLVIPIQQAPGRVRVCVWFHPHIKPGDSRSLVVRAQQKGVWNDLRALGRDNNCSYRLTDRVQELTIVMIPPDGVSVDELSLIPDPEFDGEISTYTDSHTGREGKAWILAAPEPSADKLYEYRVECEPLSKTSRRLRMLLRLILAPFRIARASARKK